MGRGRRPLAAWTRRSRAENTAAARGSLSCRKSPTSGGPAVGKVAEITARGAIYASSDLPSMVRFDRARATLSGPLHPSDVAKLSAMVPAVT